MRPRIGFVLSHEQFPAPAPAPGLGVAAEQAGFDELWRFIPVGFTELLDQPDPREIQRLAEERVSLEDVYRNWVVSEDPQVHAQAIQKLLDRGATNVFIHSGQSDQQRVIGFYAHEVLPQLRRLTHVA